MEGDRLGNRVTKQPEQKQSYSSKIEYTGPCPACGKNLQSVNVSYSEKERRGKKVKIEVPECSNCKS